MSETNFSIIKTILQPIIHHPVASCIFATSLTLLVIGVIGAMSMMGAHTSCAPFMTHLHNAISGTGNWPNYTMLSCGIIGIMVFSVLTALLLIRHFRRAAFKKKNAELADA